MSRAPDGLTMSLRPPRTNIESEGIAPLILNFRAVSHIKEKNSCPCREWNHLPSTATTFSHYCFHNHRLPSMHPFGHGSDVVL